MHNGDNDLLLMVLLILLPSFIAERAVYFNKRRWRGLSDFIADLQTMIGDDEHYDEPASPLLSPINQRCGEPSRRARCRRPASARTSDDCLFKLPSDC
jgi:hypothetical protein